MTDKEKMVELLDEVHHKPLGKEFLERLGTIADHLIANGVTVQRWISVTERLPDLGGRPVLLAVVNPYGQKRVVQGFTDYAFLGEYHTNDKEYDGTWAAWKVTHWMPLPDAPKEGE